MNRPKPIFFTLLLIIPLFSIAQKKYINREIAQMNYDGYQLMLKKDYRAALALFNNAIEKDPEAFFVYQNRGLCNLYLNDTIKAINDFKTNIQLEPLNVESRYNLGNIAKKQKDTATSVIYFKEAISIQDELFAKEKVLYMSKFLANTYYARNDYDSALVYIKNVKILDSLDANNFIKSAVCNFHLNQPGALCYDLEKAFVLGAAVNCMILKKLCDGCDKPELVSKIAAPNSIVLDKRLEIMLEKTDSIIQISLEDRAGPNWNDKKVKIYFNSLWQICKPDNAAFYREVRWTDLFGFDGQYKDFYITGELFGEGTLNYGKNTGVYKTFYQNGNVQSQGEFREGNPDGQWIFYKKDGASDFEITFTENHFKLHLADTENPDYQIINGTGKFSLIVEKTGYLDYTLSGEYFNNKMHGTWIYKVGKDIAVLEEFKEGKFKKGYLGAGNSKILTSESKLNAALFIPPHLLMIKNMIFESMESVGYYPFIKASMY